MLFELSLKRNVVALKHRWPFGYSSLMIDKQASISTCSPIYLEERYSCKPACPQLSALSLATAVEETSCCTTSVKHGLREMTNFGLPASSRSDMGRLWSQAVGQIQRSETRKPSMQQLESRTHKQVSRHELRFPSRAISSDCGAARVSARWPQFVHAWSVTKGCGSQGANWVPAGHVLSQALLAWDHCTASISTSSCPLLQCLHQWHPPTLLSTYYHFLRKPNWRAGLHDRYECLSDQTRFVALVCCHFGTQHWRKGGGWFAFEFVGWRCAAREAGQVWQIPGWISCLVVLFLVIVVQLVLVQGDLNLCTPAGHVLSQALLAWDHCTASISTSSCPLLQCLHQWHPPTLLSTYYHFLRKPNWRAGLHDRYECLSDQTRFVALVCCHFGTQHWRKGGGWFAFEFVGWRCAARGRAGLTNPRLN